MAGHFVRKFLDDTSLKLPGDPTKAAVRIVEFVDAGKKGEDLPFRWMMGKDCTASVRAKITSLTDSADKSEKWSDDLQLDSVWSTKDVLWKEILEQEIILFAIDCLWDVMSLRASAVVTSDSENENSWQTSGLYFGFALVVESVS